MGVIQRPNHAPRRSRSRPRGLDEAAARQVLWVQAFESIEPGSPHWTAGDAAWATRVAREHEPALPSGGDGFERFLVRRAGEAWRRLLPREPTLASALPASTGKTTRRLGLAAVAFGFAAGLAADAVGSSQRINLLAPPVWTVVAWNLCVYGVVVAASLRHAFGSRTRTAGLFGRALERMTRRGSDPSEANAGGLRPPADPTAAALRFCAGRWSQLTAPLAFSRAAVLLHGAAAALGVGLVAGLYARGLVLDYRVAWESTFLSPAEVHSLLSILLAPASRLSGIERPDLAAVAALRTTHGDAAVGAPAAPFIHLFALTIVLAVVLPRTALAVLGALRVRWAASHLRLPLADAYFRRLEWQYRGDVARVQVCPYAQTPSAAALAGVRGLLEQALGDGVTIAVAPTTPFGGEDDPGAALEPADATVVVALFDLAATAEPEHQGRFLTALAARSGADGAATVACVDEATFRRRFGHDARRVDERRAAWSRLLATHGTVPVFGTFDGARETAPVDSLRAALGSPVQAVR